MSTSGLYWSIFRPLTPQQLNSQTPLSGSGYSRPTTSILLNILHFVLFLTLGITLFLNQPFSLFIFCVKLLHAWSREVGQVIKSVSS